MRKLGILDLVLAVTVLCAGSSLQEQIFACSANQTLEISWVQMSTSHYNNLLTNYLQNLMNYSKQTCDDDFSGDNIQHLTQPTLRNLTVNSKDKNITYLFSIKDGSDCRFTGSIVVDHHFLYLACKDKLCCTVSDHPYIGCSNTERHILCVRQMNCTFDDNECMFWQPILQKEETSVWRRVQGGTSNGPATDHTGLGGYYFYSEAPNENNQAATLSSLTVISKEKSKHCLGFFYQTFGSGEARFTIGINTHGGDRETIFVCENVNKKQWTAAKIDVEVDCPFQVNFQAVSGSIAIDDVTIVQHECDVTNTRQKCVLNPKYKRAAPNITTPATANTTTPATANTTTPATANTTTHATFQNTNSHGQNKYNGTLKEEKECKKINGSRVIWILHLFLTILAGLIVAVGLNFRDIKNESVKRFNEFKGIHDDSSSVMTAYDPSKHDPFRYSRSLVHFQKEAKRLKLKEDRTDKIEKGNAELKSQKSVKPKSNFSSRAYTTSDYTSTMSSLSSFSSTDDSSSESS